MPRPDRSNTNARPQGMPQAPMQGQSSGAPQRPQQGSVPLTGGIAADIRALNSSLLLITQKIKYIVRNEKILGRNLIVLNKKIKTLEDKINLNASIEQQGGGASGEEQKLLQQKVALLEAQIDDLRTRAAFKEELKEVKYIINSINPLEFATLSQVRELIDKRLEEKMKK